MPSRSRVQHPGLRRALATAEGILWWGKSFGLSEAICHPLRGTGYRALRSSWVRLLITICLPCWLRASWELLPVWPAGEGGAAPPCKGGTGPVPQGPQGSGPSEGPDCPPCSPDASSPATCCALATGQASLWGRGRLTKAGARAAIAQVDRAGWPRGLGRGAGLSPWVQAGGSTAAHECRGPTPMYDSAAGSTQAGPGLWEVGRPLSSA